VNDPSPTPTTTNQDQGEAAVDGEVASRGEPPRRVQVDHPASRIIDNMNEPTTRSMNLEIMKMVEWCPRLSMYYFDYSGE
jgi:hypothetical protein